MAKMGLKYKTNQRNCHRFYLWLLEDLHRLGLVVVILRESRDVLARGEHLALIVGLIIENRLNTGTNTNR